MTGSIAASNRRSRARRPGAAAGHRQAAAAESERPPCARGDPRGGGRLAGRVAPFRPDRRGTHRASASRRHRAPLYIVLRRHRSAAASRKFNFIERRSATDVAPAASSGDQSGRSGRIFAQEPRHRVCDVRRSGGVHPRRSPLRRTAPITVESAGRALIAAIVCGVMCWASAERSIASTAGRDRRRDRAPAAAPPMAICRARCPRSPSHRAAARRGDGRAVPPAPRRSGSVQRLAMFDPVTGAAPTAPISVAPAESACSPSCPRARWRCSISSISIASRRSTTRLGHASGDVLLGMVANRLRAVADRFAADGGDPRRR